MNTLYSPLGDNAETESQRFAWVPAGPAVLAVFCGAVWGVVALAQYFAQFL